MVYIVKPTVLTVDTVDWADIVSAISLETGEEVIDARSFGNPRATTTGGGQDSVTMTILWSAAAQALLAAEAGDDVALVVTVDGGSYGCTIHVPDTLPAPPLAVGQKAEVEVMFGVTDAIAWTPPS